MNISIIIVNWNSCALVRECIASIRRTCTRRPPQVIVVDSGSFDGCGTMLARDFPEVEFVQSPENIGFGRANNLGAARATGELLLLLNPDTELLPDAVEELSTSLLAHPRAGLAGARLIGADGSVQLTSVHDFPGPWNTAADCEWLRARQWRKRGIRNAREAVEVEAVSGACMLIRADLFRRIGGFNPSYFMYAEDMDLCARVRRAGHCVIHTPAARVIHHGGACTPADASSRQYRTLRDSVGTFIRDHHGKRALVLHRFATGCFSLARIPLAALWALSRKARASGKPRRALLKARISLAWAAGISGKQSGANAPRILIDNERTEIPAAPIPQ